ncbi:arylsulfatase [Echinicola salinicaeni]|uniref:arylsulfatase n=1 Tax=Echinicola salinicaeni TaxID=2762757 RepID=UPI00164463F3|nr:arylsulfatase [Echinicola salinicaeni]
MKTKNLPYFILVVVMSIAFANKMYGQEILPFPPTPSASKAGITLSESTHQKRQTVNHLPEDAPNIVIILIDDVGPGQAGTYGGEFNTPTLSKISKEGISYNRFHSTAMCSPTRASLLTGRNHHKVGNGQIPEYANDWDGYTGVIPKSAATVAEVLKNYGYSTSAFGKWHNTAPEESSAAGPFDHWPTGYGFEYFYGFMAGDASQYEPTLFENTTLVPEEHFHKKGYHLSEDLADQAINWMRQHKAIEPDKPFLMYWSSGAVHGPHHVTKEWADKYKGKFDDGWDAYRKRVYEKAKKLGWIPENAKLTPRPSTMQAWDDIPEDERAFQLRLMEVYAGYAEHVDAQVGKVIDELDNLGYEDNTLVFYIWGDNGASSEGQQGTLAELLAQNGVKTTTKQQIEALNKIGGLDELGGSKVENMMHAGWAWGGSSPYKGTKLVAAYFGGTRQPMAVRWPKVIKPDNVPRSQFHHVNDIVPTIYDILNITPPRVVNGAEQMELDGTSMKYTFDNPTAEGRKGAQYFEIHTSRGIYKDGWFACAFGVRTPWVQGLPDFDNWDPMKEPWELYNLEEDWSQANDLAKSNPDKLDEMKSTFLVEAARNNVLPIGGTFWSTAALHPEDAPASPMTEWNFAGPIKRIPEAASPRFGSTSNQMDFDVTVPKNANGVLCAVGGYPGGVSFFIKDGYLNYEYCFFLMDRTRIVASEKLPEGKVNIQLLSELENGPASALNITIKVNGKEVAKGKVPRSIASTISYNDGFDIGQDLGSPVSDAYFDSAPFTFNGKINKVVAKYLE